MLPNRRKPYSITQLSGSRLLKPLLSCSSQQRWLSSSSKITSPLQTLGNMSNPCINRWGLNVFWHHHWYSDSRYALNLRQDKLATTLVQSYLSFGLDVPSNFFWNPYWFNTQAAEQSPDINRYYRWILAKSTALRSVTEYRLRIESEEVYQTFVTVLRFNSYFIINMYWFQPDKGRKRRLMKARHFHKTISYDPARASLSHLAKWKKLTSVVALGESSRTARYVF